MIRCFNHHSLKFYNNVDCSDITYDTPPSPTILEAVEKAKQRLNATEGDLILSSEILKFDAISWNSTISTSDHDAELLTCIQNIFYSLSKTQVPM